MIKSPTSAKEAKAIGAQRYFTGKPCLRGHTSERYVWGGCVQCSVEKSAASVASGKAREIAAKRRSANPEAHRSAVKRHRERHPDLVKDRVCSWRQKNIEHIQAYRKQYAVPRRDELIERHREYYHSNKDAARERHRRWRKENPEASRARCANRRAMRLSAQGTITTGQIARLVEKQCGRCAACGANDRLTIDHIIALSRGGSNLPENLQMLCHSCNSSKKDRPNDEFMSRMKNATS